jgi:Bacterial transcriptional activator domain
VHLAAAQDSGAGGRRPGGADAAGCVPAAGGGGHRSASTGSSVWHGTAARARGERPGRAAAGLREALALWRGAPLADFSVEPFAQVKIARLDELRCGATEDRIEADLALGRHAAVVSELEALIAVYPMRERPHQQLMIALYRCGRQAEALAVYRSARGALVEELGIEPSPGLERVERAILQQDVSPAAPGAGRGPQAIATAGDPRSPPATDARRTRLLTAAGTSLAVILA